MYCGQEPTRKQVEVNIAVFVRTRVEQLLELPPLRSYSNVSGVYFGGDLLRSSLRPIWQGPFSLSLSIILHCPYSITL
jgi:hypothetical protein